MSEEIKLHPFNLHENIYFIGNEEVSVHLIDTEAGLVLIDTGFPNMLEVILSGIDTLGFEVKNVKHIFHSHGHIDHYGTTGELLKLCCAKTYISREDYDIVSGKLDLSWAKEIDEEPLPPLFPDVIMKDGDVYDFGNTTVRCIHTPGHTDGVMSFIVTLSDGTVAAMHGGMGSNSMRAEFLKKYGLSFDCREKFKDGLVRLEKERVDLVLGNHPEQNDTVGKMIKRERGEDVRDGGEWALVLERGMRMITSLMEKDKP